MCSNMSNVCTWLCCWQFTPGRVRPMRSTCGALSRPSTSRTDSPSTWSWTMVATWPTWCTRSIPNCSQVGCGWGWGGCGGVQCSIFEQQTASHSDCAIQTCFLPKTEAAPLPFPIQICTRRDCLIQTFARACSISYGLHFWQVSECFFTVWFDLVFNGWQSWSQMYTVYVFEKKPDTCASKHHAECAVLLPLDTMNTFKQKSRGAADWL